MQRAIIVFAKQPVAGTVKTRLAATIGNENAAEFYRCALADTLELVASVENATAYLAFAPPDDAAKLFFTNLAPHFKLLPQTGETLGDKIYNALQTAIENGAEQTLIIGSDSPDLPRAHLAAAFAALDDDETDVVLGRADDGGYYLIGMRRARRILFERIEWSSEKVAAQTIERANESKLNLIEIEPWYDLDVDADLFKLIAAARTDARYGRRAKEFVEKMRSNGDLKANL